jgi:hypothetical protein
MMRRRSVEEDEKWALRLLRREELTAIQEKRKDGDEYQVRKYITKSGPDLLDGLIECHKPSRGSMDEIGKGNEGCTGRVFHRRTIPWSTLHFPSIS